MSEHDTDTTPTTDTTQNVQTTETSQATQSGWEPDVDPELDPGFYGFVATEPTFSDENGKPYMSFRAGQIRYEYHPDGSRTRRPTTFHTIIAFEGAAVHGDRQPHKRDVFLAFGRLEERPHPETGEPRKRFVANRLGHDLARMNYQVGTPRRFVDMQPTREQPRREHGRTPAFEPAEHDAVGTEQPARSM